MNPNEIIAHMEHSRFWLESSKELREAFIEYMSLMIYGRSETVNAFHHFKAGWEAHTNRR